MKRYLRMIAFALILILCLQLPQGAHASSQNPVWKNLRAKYRNDTATEHLLCVKRTASSKARITLYSKSNGKWKVSYRCKANVGKAGIGKGAAYISKTPVGCYNVTGAFGIKSKPKTKLPYLKVKSYHYWCCDKGKYYNKLIDRRKTNHICRDYEHLIDYKGYYDYGLFFDYNKKGIYPKASAIFFHVAPTYKGTAGCISVKAKDMLQILKKINRKTKICIYEAYA